MPARGAAAGNDAVFVIGRWGESGKFGRIVVIGGIILREFFTADGVRF